MFVRILSTLFIAALAAGPALAQSGGVAVPEPSTMALFGLGAIGVLVGRRLSSRRPDE
ncbi:MAG: PEP-CTERM sorting domain-containing protein [Novosphingobium sp.]